MKLLKSGLVVAVLALLGGCVVAPPAPDYGYYGYAPGYYYTPAPYYYGPSVSFGFYGGRGWGGHGHGHWR